MPPERRYHHGDLRRALIEAAARLLRDEGIDGLSLRKLADQVGVSRMAPYHYFPDKHALLCALAARGFQDLTALIEAVRIEPGMRLDKDLRRFVRAYIHFATTHPEQYELMFGRTIWKNGVATPELRTVAWQSFRRYVDRVRELVSAGTGRRSTRSLRVAQASWATLHGLCRLLLDGIYLDRKDMEAVSDEAVRLLRTGLTRQPSKRSGPLGSRVPKPKKRRR